MDVREYLTADGRNPYREWLDVTPRARIQARVLRFDRESRRPQERGRRRLGSAGHVRPGISDPRRQGRRATRAPVARWRQVHADGGRGASAGVLEGVSGGQTSWQGSEGWNVGLAKDLRDAAFAREFLLASIDEGVELQLALGKVIRAMGVKEFAARVRMASPNVLRAINPRHNPTQDTLNRLLKPFKLRLSLAPLPGKTRPTAA